MKSFKEFIVENRKYLPSEFKKGMNLYHSHNNDNIKDMASYPEGREFIYAAESPEETQQYGRHIHNIYVRPGLKTAELFKNPTNKDALESIHKKFGPKAVETITKGKLWRNKPLEKEVHDHLHDEGYEHIAHTDELGEKGGETTSHLIHNPHKNIYVGFRHHFSPSNSSDDDYDE